MGEPLSYGQLKFKNGHEAVVRLLVERTLWDRAKVIE